MSSPPSAPSTDPGGRSSRRPDPPAADDVGTAPSSSSPSLRLRASSDRSSPQWANYFGTNARPPWSTRGNISRGMVRFKPLGRHPSAGPRYIRLDILFPLVMIWIIATIVFTEHFFNQYDTANQANSMIRQSRTNRHDIADQANSMIGQLRTLKSENVATLYKTDVRHLSELPTVVLSHGTFHFGPDSKSALASPAAALIASQQERRAAATRQRIDDDEEIDIQREKDRCASYSFGFPDGPVKRRRLFLGSLIAYESIEGAISAVGMEAYNVFHTVAFIESNSTLNMSPRKWTYLDDDDRPSTPLMHQLYQLFGPKTKVSVDYYTTTRKKSDGTGRLGALHEAIQREGILHRWKLNGMQPDDVAIVSDTDETFTRDFLRALQICDIPNFRPGQDCREPKVFASSFIYESSLDCVNRERRWHHPDAVLGECVELIGDSGLHPLARRDWTNNDNVTSHGQRLPGWGRHRNYSFFNKNEYPLWSAEDIRTEMGGMAQISKNDKFRSPTGYHFHNFFQTSEEIHYKYFTYGHSVTAAMETPIWELSADMELGVRCAKGVRTMGWHSSAKWTSVSFNSTLGSSQPMWYQEMKVLDKRHTVWKNIVAEEEERFGNYPIKNADRATASQSDNHLTETEAMKRIIQFLHGEQIEKSERKVPIMKSNWESSKSAILGLATNLPLWECRKFVDSLRATGYSGHLILGIAPDAPQGLLDYFKEAKVTTKVIEMASNCTFNVKNWHCPKAYPDYKITWARFPMYRDWLNECPECTDGIILTDVRDVYWQRDPFTTAGKLGMEHNLMVFEEIFPALDTTNWLTKFPVDQCKKFNFGKTPMLCSGSVMGSREGIIDYVNTIVEEFDVWIKDENCRIDLVGDDQSVHNYLYYAGKLEGAVAIPYRTGPVHVVGWIANKMWRTAEEQAKKENRIANNFYLHDDIYQEWLPQQYEFIDPETGLILNLDGSPSAQVHQVDRFGTLNLRWLQKMRDDDWPYNKEQNNA